MRNLTKQLVLLFAVFVIYFGYSAWIDGLALYHASGAFFFNTLTGEAKLALDAADESSSVWIPIAKGAILAGGQIQGATFLGLLDGFMAQNSLLYSILTPFKMVLVGGVFALFVPLTKTIFFGTIIGIKDYMKARRGNVLYNYKTTIAFSEELTKTIKSGDYEAIKAKYKDYAGLAFRPQFLTNMMDEIGQAIISEKDTAVYAQPSKVITLAIQEMYEKERNLAINGKPEEMFFDFKRGYEYTSIGSKYSIAYYKNLDTKVDSKNKLGWKIFSLEMFKFYVALVAAIIPTLLISIIVLPLISNLIGGKAALNTAPGLILVGFFIVACILHALFTFTKSHYKNMKSTLVLPAITFYALMILLALTFSIGVNRIIIAVPDLTEGGSMSKLWIFFAVVGYAVLTTTLVMYVIATIMDGNKATTGMTKKLFIDGVIIPLLAWFVSTILLWIPEKWIPNATTWSMLIAAAFWIYLSISSFLINNLTIPNRKIKNSIQNGFAVEGTEAEEKIASEIEKNDKKEKIEA